MKRRHTAGRVAALAWVLLCLCLGVQAQVPKTLNATLEGYAYPYEVKFFPVSVEGEKYRMAYMDVQPTGQVQNPQTVVLLHGKNFLGAYWEETIRFLTNKGFRVIVPDQIGFGKSEKPEIYYSFHQLAENTKELLQHLGVEQTAVVGHSMGGMLATRFALLYPEMTTKLVLENPIGLEDYRLFVPYKTVEELYQAELKRTASSIRDYHQTYYTSWKPAYNEWVQVPAAQINHPDYPKVAKASALTYAMIYQQPVVYEFDQLKVPTLLVIGQEDRTIVGKGYIKDKQKLQEHGQYPTLGKRTANAIPKAKLVELEGVGHIPHLAATERFQEALLNFLK
ncbi:pimeloyl-ACP methyl ester carboxylesterase [Pontibacter ummariensis]|uniref:Pimeloyl-ACP methyl ester carboxylesterase n=1 Tax=Pontibacter ummariensis TaxID=1610492 RepID=A0A239GDB0_9BACT|nr:alpha/beta hydrolase [Pontibacter ummariensis]PRY11210.1 pimeloyl-ACP methyl ester carboxylesterase [Pontibacter ummariensis]SNS67147.1 Pimeloyl-ACP methyl ester carboxylesterase [Pontibacter ummariensis]